MSINTFRPPYFGKLLVNFVNLSINVNILIHSLSASDNMISKRDKQRLTIKCQYARKRRDIGTMYLAVYLKWFEHIDKLFMGSRTGQ
jgi:hypothetical protein